MQPLPSYQPDPWPGPDRLWPEDAKRCQAVVDTWHHYPSNRIGYRCTRYSRHVAPSGWRVCGQHLKKLRKLASGPHCNHRCPVHCRKEAA